MAKLKEELWKTLQDLKEEEFENFKWFLEQDGLLEGLSGIPVSQLEKAKRQHTVDLMVQKYPGSGALKVTLKILENIHRNDLKQHLQNLPLGHNNGAKKEEYKGEKPKLQWVQQFAVDVTLDPDTANPHLILSGNRKQVRHGDVRRNLPNNPERFYRCVNVLGKQSFSSGKFYFQVQVEGKTAWDLGVAKESIERKVQITASPQNGYWALMMRNGCDYGTMDGEPVLLSLTKNPKKVGVFVNYDEGLVFFYDVDTADILYFFSGCSFTEKLYPFFSPCTNDGGINSAPLIISSVNDPLSLETRDTGDQKEEHEKKKAELKSAQQFAVDVTLDPDTANPHLILSRDGKQVRHGDVMKKLPDNPERFKKCVSILGKQGFASGKFYFEVQVKGKTAWDLGVAEQSIKRKIQITTSPQHGYWTIVLRNENDYEAIDDDPVCLSLNQPPQKVGVFVDIDEGLVCFYDVDSADLLHSFTGCYFTEKLYPYFSPCTNDGGVNSAPLIISPVNQETNDTGDQKELERKAPELKSVQQFVVDVTLDPDTAHPHLILSDDGKQVHHSDVRNKLPDKPQRFTKYESILGKPSLSSGKYYYEVQVKGKTAWDLGVANQAIKKKVQISTNPENGFWTIKLRNQNEYEANDDDPVQLSLKSHLQKVGVFVDYDEGLVCFYDVDSADLIYSFTGCYFTGKLYPFFSPCTNDGGVNSAPLIISSVNHPLSHKTHDISDEKAEYKRKKAELKRIQQFAVDVTLDPDTANPHLILSDDGKQVHHSDVKKTLPNNPERFYSFVNVLGKQSFSSGKFYYEVQVEGKTAWALGVAKQSIKRKLQIAACPQNGFWTIMLTNEDVYEANDDDPVQLSLNHPLQKVGVFVDYEEDLVSFYNVDSADLLYSFTGCSFTEKLYPYFSPFTNDGGVNSAPLIISPVNEPLSLNTCDFGGEKGEPEKNKTELKSVEELAVEITPDQDTARANLILSGDGKQVHNDDVREKLPSNFVRTIFCCQCCLSRTDKE
ncbi:uncharacterized protein LOC117249528 isoform X1 [Epinephelus lanceolatus]|uniref:uncharacterized protein LOC117249528 n=1 Tax=Epinephelus lanceolatus TaxID=310571 RepID=UPI001445A5D9|nr:uncharacterized protein LOC117249528 [Epinephelus lanceolatus]XP_033471135.1 uncharacterized protein LOC117249528 [Epinephelus lanceolatus]XP_033471136.1 uncharacterized protein LOC117249528 [Epinephelus lanceolatus]